MGIFERFPLLPSPFLFFSAAYPPVDVEKFLLQDVFILVTFFSLSQEEENGKVDQKGWILKFFFFGIFHLLHLF